MIKFGPAVVYLLCLITSLTCAALLARAYGRDRSRFLLWTALGFGALGLNNLFLVVDLLLLPSIDLWLLRQASGFLAVGLFLYGFIWERRS